MHHVSCAFAGDVMIDRTDALSILRHVSAALQGADIAYCNREGPISDRGEKHAGKVGIGRCEFFRKGIEQMRLIPIVSNAEHEPVPSRADSESGQKAMWMVEYFSERMNMKFENHGEYIEVSAES